jgi:hypothetical protein
MKRTRPHVIEDEAEKIFRAALPPEWIFRKIAKDYGVDYEVELVDVETVTGNRVWFQLKGMERVRKSVRLKVLDKQGATSHVKVHHVVYDAETELLKYALRCDFPLLLALADLAEAEVYWLPLRDEIEANLQFTNPNWRDNKKARLRIHPDNRFSAEKDKNYYGIRWYAMEPARMRGAALLHSYYHEMEYECQFGGYTLDDNYVDNPGILYHTAEMAGHYFQLALDIDCFFGPTGWEYSVVAIKPALRAGLDASKQLLDDIDCGRISFEGTSRQLFTMADAFRLISTCIACIQDCRGKFLITPWSVEMARIAPELFTGLVSGKDNK